jgi:FkbH-like protein
MLDLAREWLRLIHPLSGKVAKVLALDLDNTLWGGVIGEDGLDGIKLGHEYPGAAYLELQRVILDLRDRGVLLAICSKNNPRDALEVFERHPHMLLKQEHFAALKINWEDKASNLRAIARDLNLGSDSIAFFDDNPAEREFVRAHAPEVMVLDFPSEPTKLAETLRSAAVFERLTLSSEDRERSRYYAQDRQRAELEASSSSLEDFYRSLELVVELSPVADGTLARTAQLTQKTNQFNLTTRRYGEPEIAALRNDPGVDVLTVRTSDRFGDNGLVGVAIVKRSEDAAELDTLLLSCRVIGRTIETALLAHVIESERARGATRLLGKFVATKKNGPARDFFPKHGFRCLCETELGSDWELLFSEPTPSCPPWIELKVAASETVPV